MKKWILSTVSFIILFFSCEESVPSKINHLFEGYRGRVPGASILIIRDGEKIFENVYGFSDLEKNIPVKPETNFRLASVTKQFTAMCIMMLVERGNLSYENTLKEIFEDFPDYGDSINIQHLLQHTSGLVSYESLIDDTVTVQVLDNDVLNMMKQQDSTYFTPGSKYRYSNSGYAVLAMIVEKISGESFAKYLEKNIFSPLKMTNTVALENGISSVKNRSFGYVFEDSHFIFKDQSVISAVLGDGGIYTSVNDLYKWDQALYDEKLVSKSTLIKAFTNGKLNNGDGIDYGYGWHLKEYNGLKCIYHTGSSCGFRNILQRFPEKRFTIIILTNRAEPDLKNLANHISDLYLDFN